MATKVVHTLTEDKQGLHKQLGCMNGIFQLFDRRYLLGLHRHGQTQNRLTSGQSANGEKEFRNSSGKAKDKNQKTVEKNRASVESSRNSSSSSGSSTTFSSFDGSKRVQTEWQLPSEPTSPNLHKKQPDWLAPPTDIRDVVKESMTREIRVTTNERARPVIRHIDSPRPFVHQKSVQYDRKDRKPVKEADEISRLSCDERESIYSLKSTFKVKEAPRLSLDSKQNSNQDLVNESRSEPGSNKRPLSGVVARLMGLDGLPDSVSEVQTLKIKPAFSDQSVPGSPRVNAKIKPAFQLHEEGDRAYKKASVYGEMEKRLNALKFNTSGKDLRALKQILEAIQMTKTGLKNKEQSLQSVQMQKPNQPCSATVKGTSSPKRRELMNQAMSPAKMATEPKMLTDHHVNHKARNPINNHSLKNMKAASRTPSIRLQKSKNGGDKTCFNRQSSDSSRIKTQSNSKPKHPRIRPIKPVRTGKLKEASTKLEIKRNDQSKEDHKISKGNSSESLIEDEPNVKVGKVSVEQQSPVSVLDAYFTEDTPSPVKNQPNENLHGDQTECNPVGIFNLVDNTDANQHSQLNHVESENTENSAQMVSPSECPNGDHGYIREILSASGFLQNLDSAIRIVQLHPTGSLTKPELFQLLESKNVEADEKNYRRSKSNERIRRKLIFDSVNEILSHKLAKWNGKGCGKLMKGEILVKEVCSEIDILQNCSKRSMYDDEDDDDEVKNLVNADVNGRSEDWDKCCSEVPGVVLDIERQIFKDLIDEVVSLHERPRRHCRRLFSS